MNLCATYKESFTWTAAQSNLSLPSSKNHHLTHRDWMQAVEQCCNICKVLHDALPPGVAAHFEKLAPGVLKNTARPMEESFDAFLIWTKLAIPHGYPNARPESQQMSFLFSWMSTLVLWRAPYRCKSGVTGLWYPTRLLDLGHLESISTPRLIETANNPPEGPYQTLSHCWGKKQLICATKENMQVLYNGVYNLPQTFQDAIAATRNLGYRYLWIDSLCIVQNDPEDWAREAALMHRVYTEADCNLAAAASRDSSGGLFFKRQGVYGQCVVKNARGDVIDLFADEDLFLKEAYRSPLQTRAWVYQAWIMSKRTIHFAKSQVFWECDHLCACEVFPKGLPNTIRHDGKAKLAEDLDPFELWPGLITHYTSRDMTKSHDRLPALSGIAKWLQPHLGSPRFLAGLWDNSDLVRQLAWYSCTTKSPKPQYRAPSWSWASIDGPIFWTNPPGYFTPHLDIIDISTTPSGSDPTGPVTGGHILIQGNMGRVQIVDHKAGLVLRREDDVKEISKRHVTIRGFDVSGLQCGLYYWTFFSLHI
ncbi:heterokaryon incompatibility protein [Fusarium napiforme]|uniref:Heterokaryon incompatibility protein n=1 Tax=Fusarium napiforme TaxID=42672 RepID=A0A8H5JFB1_9HYPO|nr:heterokaryon incompatibility protein [Fusarium napiforme]